MVSVEQPARGRRRSVQKRTAMLDAAQELFLADGYERTSVDAIAARANVSKRTVYDHFGEKELVYTAVMDRVSARFMMTIKAAIEEELPEGCDLRPGLLAFVRRVATDTFSSSDYVLFRKLGSLKYVGGRVRGTARNAPKEQVVHRMAQFIEAGMLRPGDPWRTAEHFIALTHLLAMDTLDPTEPSSQAELDDILVNGVDAFLRAYSPDAR
ncbi:MAG: TetR/AcrR family transcriptional regulator [Pseudonocardia sp.]|uniref:TetR/AcrR family transcriptional regulator n=1 Tax=unclassified Pseudonocardia TaxID=2619320 RepID=UPI000869EFCA|nr:MULTISPECIES: TetR/AcrR family transcriptional regulator [unclassified Pseudonocardia]MBN9109395.1 TetR/AcrR family transcriptional regulator [Pseudonocardia sp.]ODU29959.1 MAG: hypothetical protein ABS80_01105 [Pseudonocardia sp. SCN 72-51]ODV08104.1 MAG: hypothetical protein ABT15_05295 [Pseudonocardia sp. SCN 73-27]